MNRDFGGKLPQRVNVIGTPGNKLFERGFSTTPLPSVKRQASQDKLTLNVVLNSVGKRKSQAFVVKQQSTVFQTPQVLRKAPSEAIFARKVSGRVQNSNENFRRTFTHNEKSRILISKCTGKKDRESPAPPITKQNSDSQSDQLSQPLEPSSPSPVVGIAARAETNIDTYIRLVLGKSQNIEEFLYLKKQEYDPKSAEGPNPYNLTVVDYQETRNDEQYSVKNGRVKEYFTISKKGLCHYVNNKPVDFMTLEEWMEERSIYDKIKNLKFFNKFRKWKTVNMWKRNVIRHRIEDCAKLLEEKLFFLNPNFRASLLALRKNSLELSKDMTFLTTKQESSQTCISLDQFKTLQQKRRKEVVKELTEQSRINKEIVMKGFQKCLQNLQNQPKVLQNGEDVLIKKKNISSKANRRENAYEFLGFGVQMSYQQRSELRKQCSKFVRFSYLADCLFLQTLAEIYTKSVDGFTERIEQLHSREQVLVQEQASNQKPSVVESEAIFQVKLDINFKPATEFDIVYEDIQPYDFTQNQTKEFSMLYHLNIRPDNVEEQDYIAPTKQRALIPNISALWLSVKPSCKEINDQVTHCISEGLNSLKHFQRLSRNHQMQKYVDALEDWDDIVCDTWEISAERYLDPSAFLDYYTNQHKVQRIKGIVHQGFERIEKVASDNFARFLSIYNENQQLNLSVFQNENLMNMSDCLEKSLEALEAQKDIFSRTIPVSTEVGLLKLESSEIKAKLLPSPIRLTETFKNMIPQLANERTLEVKKWLVDQTNKLRVTATQIDEYVDQVTYLKEIQKNFPLKKKQIDNLAHLYHVMHTFKIQIKDRKLFQVETIQAKDQLQQSIMVSEENAARQSERFAKLVGMTLIPDLQKQSSKLREKVLQQSFLSGNSDPRATATELRGLEAKYQELQYKKEKYVLYLQTLGISERDFSQLSSLKEDIYARVSLWETLESWEVFERRWKVKTLGELQNSKAEQEISKYQELVESLKTILPDNPILHGLSTRIDRLSVSIPMIGHLRNPNLNSSHWIWIRSKVGSELTLEDQMTLEYFMGLKMHLFKEIIQEVSRTADIQHDLQVKYRDIECRWRQLVIKTHLYKSRNKNNKEVYQILDTDDVAAYLDRLVMDILIVSSNKCCRPIKEKTSELQKTLKYSNECFTQWVSMFQDWMYLDNLFSCIDSKRIYENNTYEGADKAVKALMKTAYKGKSCYRVLAPSTKHLQKIKQVRSQLKKVVNGLNDFVAQKRKNFFWFYFVSNQELLHVICNTIITTPSLANQEAIDSLALKCFQGLQKVNIESERVNSLTTVDGEVFKKTSFSSMGQVEQIFSSIHDVMVEGVKKLMRNARVQDKDKKRWILNNHIQPVMAVLRTQFTQYTETSIVNQAFGTQALEDYYMVFADDLKDFVEQVSKEVDLASRTKLQTIIALEISHRDKIQKLIRNRVERVTDYLWVGQLRFYNEDILGEDTGITAKFMLYSIKYGSDYVQADTRLGFLTLSDKLLVNVFANFKDQIHTVLTNPIPQVKNLASSLGYQSKDYYCSSESDLSGLTNFLTGVYNIGIWGVVHNFNRLSDHVLAKLGSVMKNTGDLAVRNQKKKDLEVKPHFPFLLSIDAGYEIPQRIKSCARSYGMVRPDVDYLIQMRLMAMNCVAVPAKYEQTRQMMTEIETDCPNYSNIKESVLAGLQLSSQFVVSDAPNSLLQVLINNVDAEVFQSVIKPRLDAGTRCAKVLPIFDTDKYHNSIQRLGLRDDVGMLETIKQICFGRKSTIVVGESSFKSTAIAVSADIKGASLQFANLSICQPSVLFGDQDLESGRQGLIKKAGSRDESSWIVFEGSNRDTEALLQYALLGTLVDQEGHTSKTPSNIRFVFETTSLECLSPSLVVSSAVVNVSFGPQITKCVFDTWKSKFVHQKLQASFQNMFQDCFISCLPLAKELTGLTELHLLTSFLNIMQSFSPFVQPKQIKYSFTMSLIWGLFSTVPEQSQSRVDFLVKKHFQFLPSTESIFKLYLDGVNFKPWSSLLEGSSLLVGDMVVTEDSAKYRYLIDRHIMNPSLLIYLSGSSGTGKSTILRNLFLNQKNIQSCTISLRTQFSVKCLGDKVFRRMQTFRRKEITPQSMCDEIRILVDDISLDTDHSRLEFVRSLYERREIIDSRTLENKVIRGLRFALSGILPHDRLLRHTMMVKLELPEGYFNAIWDVILQHNLGPDLKKHSAGILSSCVRFHNRAVLEHPNTFFNRDLKKVLSSLSCMALKDLQQARRYLQFSTSLIYAPRLANCQILTSGSDPSFSKGIHTFSPLRTGQLEEVKDRKHLINVINDKLVRGGSSYSTEFVILDYSLQRVLRLQSMLTRGNSFLVGGINQGRANSIKVVSCLMDYRVCEISSCSMLDTAVNQLYSRLAFEKTVVVFKIGNKDDLQTIDKFFTQDLDEKFVSQLRSQDLLKNDRVMKIASEAGIDSVIEQYRKWLKDNLKFVCLIDRAELWELVLSTKLHLLQMFEMDHYTNILPKDLEELALTIFQGEFLENVKPVLQESLPRLAQVHNLICQHLPSSLKQFQDYIRLFSQLIHEFTSNLGCSKTMYSSSLDRLQTIESQIQLASHNIQELRIECKLISTEIGSLTVAKQTGEQELAVQKYLGNSKVIQDNYAKLSIILDKRIQEIKRTTSMLDNYDQQKLRLLKVNLLPNSPITYLSEFLMILIGEDLDLGRIKEMFSLFKQLIARLKDIKLRDLSYQLVRKFREHSKKEEMNYEFLKKVPLGSELANIYISFKNLIVQREKQTELVGEIRSKVTENGLLKQSVPDLEERVKQQAAAQAVMDGKAEHKSLVQKQIQDLTFSKSLKQKMVGLLSKQALGWKEMVTKQDNKLASLQKNLLLMSAYFIYLPHLVLDERKRMFKVLKARLGVQQFSFYDQLDIDDQFMRTYNIEQTVFQDMIIMNNCLKPMLLLDQESKGLEWMKTFVKDIRIVKQDQQHDIVSVVGDCIANGSHLMVEVSKFLSPELQMVIRKMDDETPMKIGDREVLYSPQFKLYIAMNKPLEITQQILNKLTVVNFAPGVQRIERDVRLQIISQVSPDFLDKYAELVKRKISIRSELGNQKKSLIQVFSKTPEVSEDLVKELESPATAIAELNKMLSSEEHNLQNISLPPISSLVSKAAICFYQVLLQFHKAYARQFSILSYLAVVKKGIQTKLITDEKTLIRYIHRFYQLTMTASQVKLLNVILIFSLISLDSDLKDLILKASGPSLKEALRRDQRYSYIVVKLENNQERWVQAVGSAEYFNMDLKANIAQRLVIARILEPCNQMSVYQKLIGVILGDEYLTRTVDVQGVAVMFSAPIILICATQEQSIAQFFGKEQVVYVRRVDQLELLQKKALIDKSFVCVRELSVQQVEELALESKRSIYLVVQEYTQCKYPCVQLTSETTKESRLLSVQAKVKSPEDWKQLYLGQLLLHFFKLHNLNNQNQILVCLRMSLSLQSLLGSFRSESEGDVSVDYSKILSQVLINTIYGQDQQLRRVAAGILNRLSAIGEEPTPQQMAARLQEDAMCEFLEIEPQVKEQWMRSQTRRFFEQLSHIAK